MAFNSLDDTLIQVGKPIKREIFTTLKANQDDLQSRLSNVETTTTKLIVFDFPVLNATSASTLTGLTYFEASGNFNLSECKVGIFEKGSLGGTLEIDVQKGTSRDPSSFSSVFTTKPSIAFASASDYDNSSNAAFDSSKILVSANNVLRLDVTSLPTGGTIGKFFIKLIGEST